MISSLRLTRFTLKMVMIGLGSFYGYHAFYDMQKPKPYDFRANKGKKKDIIIVGSGMTGLVVAYYLSAYSHNNIKILEWDELPFRGTSK